MKVSTSSPQISPHSDKPPRKRNPLFSSASDETHRPHKEKRLKRRLSASTSDLSKNSLYLGPNTISSRPKFTKRRATNSEQFDGYLDGARLQLKRMSKQIIEEGYMKGSSFDSEVSEGLLAGQHLNAASRHHGISLSSLTEPIRAQFAHSQTPPMPTSTFVPMLGNFNGEHRGELDMAEKYNYDLSKAQLKASSRTSALLAGFAMVALVELQYDQDTPRPVLILLGVITSLLVSVHLLALMMSTCILPYMEATGCTQDSPHLKLKFYIDLSWIFSTCIGLLLFLVEIGIIFFVKFDAVGYRAAAYLTTAMLIPVVVVFIVFSYLIHKNRVSHSLGRFKDKVDTMKQMLDAEAQITKPGIVNI